MEKIKGGLEGIPTGSSQTIAISQNGQNASRAFTNYGINVAATVARPLIFGPQAVSGTATVDTSRLTNLQSIQWRVKGGANLGTEATQSRAGTADSYLEVVTVSDEGTLTSPASLTHMEMMGSAEHNLMDASIVGLMPHNDADKIAVANGLWSSPATWADSNPPVDTDKVLIPEGVAVEFDVDAPATLIRQLRVDGTLTFATATNTHLYVRDLIGDRLSTIAVGNSTVDRVTANSTITFEGQTPLDLETDPELLGRGIATLGRLDVFGKDMLDHSRAAFGEPIGSASIILEKSPVGWGVGDQIIIGSTSIDMPVGVGVGILDVAEDEIVTITGFGAGNEVQFSPPLEHPHNNQNTESTRTDIRPMVQLRAQSRNVIFKSEVTTPVTQRGYVMTAHPYSRTDLWDCGLIELGRTDKTRPVGGRVGNDFVYHDGLAKVSVPITADANIRGRYSFHAHKVGYSHLLEGRPMPILVHVTTEGSPGWGVVHHDNEMEIRASSTFRVYGCGFAAEQGGELGIWHDLSAMQATAVNLAATGNSSDDIYLAGSVKGMEGNDGVNGDYFKDGIGFGFRGRSVKATDCIATTCVRAHEYWHRANGNGNETLFFVTNPPRDRMDLKETGLMSSAVIAEADEWAFANYPIVHFTNCGAIACIQGFGVTKQTPQQNHDYNVNLKGYFAHGCRTISMLVSYVGTYIIQDLDIVGGKASFVPGITQRGLSIGDNAFQMAVVRGNIEATRYSGLVFFDGVAPPLFNDPPFYIVDEFDSVTDPLFLVVGTDLTNCGYVNGSVEAFSAPQGQGVKSFADHSVNDDDFDGTYINHTLTPTETMPDVVGTFAGGLSGTITDPPDNTKGLKFGNHPVGLGLVKTWFDGMFPQMGRDWQTTTNFNNANNAAAGKMTRFAERYGYHQLGANDVLVQRDIISDIVTGRPAKATFLWQADSPITIAGAADNGPIIMAPEVTTTDLVVTVAPNGTHTFNALVGAGGGDGTGNYEIDPGDFVSPDYGDLSIDYVTGDVTYTPVKGLDGQADFGYIFIRSVRDTAGSKTETRTYGTKRLAYLISSDDSLLAPVENTDFTVAGGVGVINFDLLARPNSGGRRILRTDYSTDSGVTWRRLRNGFYLGARSIDVDSTGAALTEQSYNIRLRYETDHEYGFSPETADINVTVT